MNLPKHMPALDGLRGIAILMVVLTHVGGGWIAAMSIYQNTLAWHPTFALPDWLARIAGSADHGVQLFFVISAFTLTLRVPRDLNSLAGYALRRIARVGPGYWLAGFGYTLLAGLVPRLWAPNGVAPLDLLVAGIFGSAWQGGAALAVVPGGWSVACEAAFYVALPLLVWAINGQIWRAVMLTGLAALVALIRTQHAMDAGTWTFPASVHPIEQAPVFLFGIMAALVAMQETLPRVRGAVAVMLILAIGGLPVWHASSNLAFVGLAAPAVALAAIYPPRLLACAAMRKIGQVSYSMYLVHFVLLAPCLRVAEWMAPGDDWRTMLLHFILTTAAAFVAACAAYRLIERPAINWAANYTRRASAGMPAPAI
jgi:exopolysaccharide production protein ExoZ